MALEKIGRLKADVDDGVEGRGSEGQDDECEEGDRSEGTEILKSGIGHRASGIYELRIGRGFIFGRRHR
ncbi:MAG: hypothetical protein Q8M76_06040 [Spirochaetaceae bacterium]|nr:hypothetical protein [Spirochaetaceae bacterium]